MLARARLRVTRHDAFRRFIDQMLVSARLRAARHELFVMAFRANLPQSTPQLWKSMLRTAITAEDAHARTHTHTPTHTHTHDVAFLAKIARRLPRLRRAFS